MSRNLVGLFAAAFMSWCSCTLAQSIRPIWSTDGQRFWYAVSDEQGSKSFYIVDVADRQQRPAFDTNRVAEALSDALEKKITAPKLPVQRIAFTDVDRRLKLFANGRSFLLDLDTYELEQVDVSPAESLQSRLFLPPRRSENGAESTQITIENRLSYSVDLLWIGTDGSQRNYGTIAAGGNRRQHTYVGHVWLLKDAEGKSIGCFSAEGMDYLIIDQSAVANVDRDTRRRMRSPTRNRQSRNGESPDGMWTAFVRQDNLWIRGSDGEQKLSSDASDKYSFAKAADDPSPDVRWSPDSRYLVAFQTKRIPERKVHFIESTPDDQLQPKLQSYDYAKPGDEISTATLHLYKLSDLKEIPVSSALFENPWSLQFRGWSPSGDHFYLQYNQRGHQTIRLLEVSAVNGSVRAILEESSDTFLHYSDRGKSVYEDLGDGTILWASERSGWNHLYRYRLADRTPPQTVTQGSWNVKRIEKIDPESEQIWFYAVGVYPDQDPYYEHFCRVEFDGQQFKVLTRGDGTHRIRFQQDDQYFLDTYSRVDMAPITELRDSQTGAQICELYREDTREQFGNRRLTERFVAMGRDGKTDIWGIIHWPENFDPEKKYPVVENIYAGPQDHHVPKSFRSRYRHQHEIADSGMIVVQIDGMGTAWRSKEFHDVCYKNLRDAGFPDRIAWFKAAAERYPQMDLSRVGIYGGSAGGQNAMAALLWHHDFYKVAVADCGCHDNRMDKMWWNEQWMGWPVDESYVENSNMENAHLLQGNLMLIVGELDRNVDPASTTQVVRRLIEHDKDFEFVLVAGTGHGAAETPWASRKRLNFLKRHLLAE